MCWPAWSWPSPAAGEASPFGGSEVRTTKVKGGRMIKVRIGAFEKDLSDVREAWINE